MTSYPDTFVTSNCPWVLLPQEDVWSYVISKGEELYSPWVFASALISRQGRKPIKRAVIRVLLMSFIARILFCSIDISPLILITISIIRKLGKRCQYEFIEFVDIKYKGNTAFISAGQVRIAIINWVKLLSLLSIVLTKSLRFILRYCPIYTSNHGYRERKTMKESSEN